MTTGSPHIPVGELRGLTQHEWRDLIAALLEAEGIEWISGPVPREPDFREDGEREPTETPAPLLARADGVQVLVEAHRSGRTVLDGVSLQGVALRASEQHAEQAWVFVTGSLDAERQSVMADILTTIRRGTGVEIKLYDGEQLAGRVSRHPALASAYFPTEAEAEESAREQRISPLVVRAASFVAPRTRDARGPFAVRRLAWTAALVFALIWLPVKVDQGEARLIGGLGLLLIALAAGLANRADQWDRASADSVMDALIPTKDEMAVRRGVTTKIYGNGPAGLVVDTLKQIPVALVRTSTQTALLLFLVTCALTYLLLWGLDSGAFAGVGQEAQLGDFMNLAGHAAFFNLPGDIDPESRVARGLVGAEFVLSAVLLGSYAAFFGFTRPSGPDS